MMSQMQDPAPTGSTEPPAEPAAELPPGPPGGAEDDADAPEVVAPDAVDPEPTGDGGAERARRDDRDDAVTEPAKVMRIGSMIKLLLEEVRATTLDESSRERLAEVYERSVAELSTALSADLQEELLTLNLPFEDEEVPTEAELRVAKAQLLGWLEGLFHGIQASLMAQQLAARQQLEGMRQLPDGMPLAPGAGRESASADRPGTYL
jgi:hypothetical protein